METIQVRIRGAKELHEALRSDDPNLRAAVVATLGRSPRAALALGRHGDRDALDMLLELADHDASPEAQAGLLRALAAFGDRRVAEPFTRWFMRGGPPRIVEPLARGIAASETDGHRRFLHEWLRQDTCRDRARAVALALAPETLEEPALRIRRAVAVASAGERAEEEVEGTGPSDAVWLRELDGARVELWLRELAGPFATEARSVLRSLGRPAFRGLADRASTMAVEDRVWLLRWGAEEHPLDAVDALRAALEEGPPKLVRVALELLPALGQAGSLFRGLLTPLAGHDDAGIRAAAVTAGAAVDLRALMAAESDAAVRSAAVARLAKDEGAAAIPEIAGAMGDHSWRVRSAAAAALRSLGEVAVPTAKDLAQNGTTEVRVAALQVLLAAGQDDWVEQRLPT